MPEIIHTMHKLTEDVDSHILMGAHPWLFEMMTAELA